MKAAYPIDRNGVYNKEVLNRHINKKIVTSDEVNSAEESATEAEVTARSRFSDEPSGYHGFIEMPVSEDMKRRYPNIAFGQTVKYTNMSANHDVDRRILRELKGSGQYPEGLAATGKVIEEMIANNFPSSRIFHYRSKPGERTGGEVMNLINRMRSSGDWD